MRNYNKSHLTQKKHKKPMYKNQIGVMKQSLKNISLLNDSMQDTVVSNKNDKTDQQYEERITKIEKAVLEQKRNFYISKYKLSKSRLHLLQLQNLATFKKLSLAQSCKLDISNEKLNKSKQYYALSRNEFNLLHKVPKFVIQVDNLLQSKTYPFSDTSTVGKNFFIISINPLKPEEFLIYQLNLLFNKYNREDCFSYSWLMHAPLAKDISKILLDREDGTTIPHHNPGENHAYQAFHRHEPFFENIYVPYEAKVADRIYHAPAKRYSHWTPSGEKKFVKCVDYDIALQNFFDSMNIYSLVDDESLPNRLYKTKQDNLFVEKYSDKYNLTVCPNDKKFIQIKFDTDFVYKHMHELEYIKQLTIKLKKRFIVDFTGSCYNLSYIYNTKNYLLKNENYKSIPIV